MTAGAWYLSLGTGYVDRCPTTEQRVKYEPNQRIDVNADDALGVFWQTTRAQIVDDLKNNPEFQTLMKINVWGDYGRELYERILAEAVSERVDAIPGLGDYRITREISEDFSVAKRRATNLNDLSTDIENNTTDIEYDCEAMSVFEGTLMQAVENEILEGGTGLKSPHNYYYTPSNLEFFATDKIARGEEIDLGGHAYITSSATGNIIESTYDPSLHTYCPYSKTQGNYTFADAVAGSPAVTGHGNVYMSYTFSPEVMERRAEAIANGDLLALKNIKSDVSLYGSDAVRNACKLAALNPHLYKPEAFAPDKYGIYRDYSRAGGPRNDPPAAGEPEVETVKNTVSPGDKNYTTLKSLERALGIKYVGEDVDLDEVQSALEQKIAMAQLDPRYKGDLDMSPGELTLEVIEQDNPLLAETMKSANMGNGIPGDEIGYTIPDDIVSTLSQARGAMRDAAPETTGTEIPYAPATMPGIPLGKP